MDFDLDKTYDFGMRFPRDPGPGEIERTAGESAGRLYDILVLESLRASEERVPPFGGLGARWTGQAAERANIPETEVIPLLRALREAGYVELICMGAVGEMDAFVRDACRGA
jgi:hypothetical protein